MSTLLHLLHAVQPLKVLVADSALVGWTLEVLFLAPHLRRNGVNLGFRESLRHRSAVGFLELQQLFIRHIVGVVDP